MTKEMTFKHRVTKLTYVDGRLYAPGETIELTGEEAVLAAAHYGKKAQEGQVETDPVTTKLSQNVKAAKVTASTAGAE